MRRSTVIWGVVAATLGAALAIWRAPAPEPAAEAARPEPNADARAPTEPEGVGGHVGSRRPALELAVEVVRGGRPVVSARVEAWLPVPSGHGTVGWQHAAKALTGDDGVAALALPPGEVLVSAEAAGALPALRRDTLAVDGPAPRLRLELTEGVPPSGRVLAADGHAPIAGAVLRFAPNLDVALAAPLSFDAAGRADGLGRFELRVPAAARGTLTASAQGFVPDDVEVDERRPAAGLELLLRATARVEGQVTDEAGHPVQGATIRAAPAASGPVRSDPEGRFALEFAPGAVTLDAESSAGRHGLERLTVAAGAPTRGVRLVVREGAPLEVNVARAGSGEPVDGAEVSLSTEPDGLELGHARTGSDGRVRFVEIPRGRWQLAAWRGAGRRGSTLGVELPGSSAVRVELRDAATVEGAVVDVRGVALPQAEVRLTWNHRLHEPARAARTDGRGHFVFEDLLAGEVVATATLDDGASRPVRTWIGGDVPSPLRLVVVGQGTLRGHVEGATEPVTVMTLDDAEHRRFVTSAAGDFEARLPEGAYRLLAVHRGATVYRAGGQPVEVAGGRETQVTLALQEPPDEAQRSFGFMGPETGVSFENGPGGVALSWLMHDSPAFAAGLREGDLVLSIDGAAVTSALDAFPRARGHDGQDVPWVVRREGQDRSFTVPAR